MGCVPAYKLRWIELYDEQPVTLHDAFHANVSNIVWGEGNPTRYCTTGAVSCLFLNPVSSLELLLMWVPDSAKAPLRDLDCFGFDNPGPLLDNIRVP